MRAKVGRSELPRFIIARIVPTENDMGQAKRKLMGTKSVKRMRFIYLMKKISRYTDWQIGKLADNRNLK